MNCIKCDTELQQNYKISYCVSVILHAINILHSLSKHQLGKDIVTKFKSTVTESRDTMTSPAVARDGDRYRAKLLYCINK